LQVGPEDKDRARCFTATKLRGRRVAHSIPLLAEWGCSYLPNSVIPTGADYCESGGLRSGGTLCLMFASDGVGIESNRKHENTKERQEDLQQ
jgi:hypothetical protein